MESVVTTKTLNVPLNRAEGDLEIRVELEGNRIIDTWSTGVMFRGIENLLCGRGAYDGLVITPRICGICGTAHLAAASMALDAISGVTPPPNAIMIRNLALMTEHIQSDMRHAFLMYLGDFVNPAFRNQPLFAEAERRYTPFKGDSFVNAIRHTRDILKIVAIIGGQWPHSSYMVPGGVVTLPSANDLAQCRYLLEGYIAWYEERVLGCSLDRWLEVAGMADLDAWLNESDAHANSELGFYLRYARAIGLDRLGAGHGNFISYGQLDIPEGSGVRSRIAGSGRLVPAGFARGTEVEPFDAMRITEHVKHSWYQGKEDGVHPSVSTTLPYATGEESQKYSWVKAPRYNDLPAETGPLAEMVISAHPLITEMVNRNGPSALVRELARLIRPAELMPAMRRWLDEIDPEKPFYNSTENKVVVGEGFGLTQASRGALGHWVKIKNKTIEHYQVITPTSWNGSPRDANGVRGPWEEALAGTTIEDPENPVEIGLIVRSFDPCLVCAVHAVRGPKSLFRTTV
ncbi:MAG: nickel-dependent hydrogenase large subunit [Planctomycetota bacterium]